MDGSTLTDQFYSDLKRRMRWWKRPWRRHFSRTQVVLAVAPAYVSLAEVVGSISGRRTITDQEVGLLREALRWCSQGADNLEGLARVRSADPFCQEAWWYLRVCQQSLLNVLASVTSEPMQELPALSVTPGETEDPPPAGPQGAEFWVRRLFDGAECLRQMLAVLAQRKAWS